MKSVVTVKPMQGSLTAQWRNQGNTLECGSDLKFKGWTGRIGSNPKHSWHVDVAR